MNPVEIENATKRFADIIAVDDLSLTVPEVYGFIGPNGSGKTTTLRHQDCLFWTSRIRLRLASVLHGSAVIFRCGPGPAVENS